MGTRVTTLEEAIAAVKKHHDQQGDDRCWLDDKELYEAFGLEPHESALPPKEEFLGNCERYHRCRQNADDQYITVEQKIEEAVIDADRDWLAALESPFDLPDDLTANVRKSCKNLVAHHYWRHARAVLNNCLNAFSTLSSEDLKKWLAQQIRNVEEFMVEQSVPSVPETGQRILLKLTDDDKKTNHGKFAAVDLDTEAIYFSESDLGALKQAKAKNDRARIYMTRIGHPGAYSLR